MSTCSEPPPAIELRTSCVDPASLGLWSRQPIAANDRFGPFEGERVQEAHPDMNPSYVWEIVDLETKEHLWYIDATDPDHGNWMRNIKCARYLEEQNIISIQEGTDIYYRAMKDIPSGVELLTWYEKVHLKRGRKRRKAPTPQPTQSSDKTSKRRSRREGSQDDATENEPDDVINQEDDVTIPCVPTKKTKRQISKETKKSSPKAKDATLKNTDTEETTQSVVKEEPAILENGVHDKTGDSDVVANEEAARINAKDGIFHFEMKKHFIKFNSAKKKEFMCDICSGIYRHSFSLKRHYIKHHINHAYVSDEDLVSCSVNKHRVLKTVPDSPVPNGAANNIAIKDALHVGPPKDCDSEDTKTGESVGLTEQFSANGSTVANCIIPSDLQSDKPKDPKYQDTYSSSDANLSKCHDTITNEILLLSEDTPSNSSSSIDDCERDPPSVSNDNLQPNQKCTPSVGIKPVHENKCSSQISVPIDNKNIDLDLDKEQTSSAIISTKTSPAENNLVSKSSEILQTNASQNCDTNVANPSSEKDLPLPANRDDGTDENIDDQMNVLAEATPSSGYESDMQSEDADLEVAQICEKENMSVKKLFGDAQQLEKSNQVLNDSILDESMDISNRPALKTENDCSDAVPENFPESDKVKMEIGESESGSVSTSCEEVSLNNSTDTQYTWNSCENQVKDNLTTDNKISERSDQTGNSQSTISVPSAKTVAMPGLYRCHVCLKMFDRIEEIRTHLQEHDAANELNGRWIVKRTEATRHATSSEGTTLSTTPKQENGVTLNGIEKQSPNSASEKGAMLGNTNKRQCKYCGKQFPNSRNRSRHERVHEGVRFICEHCATSFTQMSDLKKHIRRQHPTFFHECGFCTRYFSNKKLLGEHLNERHSKNVQDNKDQLGNKTENMAAIDPVMDRAESMRLASKRFNSKHVDGYKYACTVCKKGFHDYSNMCRHRRLAHLRHMMETVKTSDRRNERVFESNSIIRTRSAVEREMVDFYANVADNIHENLSNHMMGTKAMIDTSETLIKWDLSSTNGTSYDVTKYQKHQSNPPYLSKCNFPKQFRLKDMDNQFQLVNRTFSSSTCYSLISERGEDEVPADLDPQRDASPSKSATIVQFKIGQDESSDSKQDSVEETKSSTKSKPDTKNCVVCKKRFTDSRQYRKHMREEHGVNAADSNRHSNEDAKVSIMPDASQGQTTNITSKADVNIPITLQHKNPEQQDAMNLCREMTKRTGKVAVVSSDMKKGSEVCPAGMGLNLQANSSAALKVPLSVCTEDPTEKYHRYLCKACNQEFPDWPQFALHHNTQHPTIERGYSTIDPNLKQPWVRVTEPVGLLNVCSSQLQAQEPKQSLHCTKCHRRFKEMPELHKHILECADPETMRPKYVWVYQYRKQRYSKMKKKKISGWQKSTANNSSAAKIENKNGGDSGVVVAGVADFDDSEEARKPRRKPFETAYNPHRHTRRRQMTELVNNSICGGCGEDFKMISLLERHIPLCSMKDKICELDLLKSVYGAENSADSESDDDYDPSKHLCIYCEKQFTYLGSLRNHIFDICSRRKEIVEENDYLDKEWENDLVEKTGGRREPLSRRSSTSSLSGNEDDNSKDSEDVKKFADKRQRRRRRGNNWGTGKAKSNAFNKTIKHEVSEDGFVYEYYVESDLPIISFDLSDTFILKVNKEKEQQKKKQGRKSASAAAKISPKPVFTSDEPQVMNTGPPFVKRQELPLRNDDVTAEDLSKKNLVKKSKSEKKIKPAKKPVPLKNQKSKSSMPKTQRTKKARKTVQSRTITDYLKKKKKVVASVVAKKPLGRPPSASPKKQSPSSKKNKNKTNKELITKKTVKSSPKKAAQVKSENIPDTQTKRSRKQDSAPLKTKTKNGFTKSKSVNRQTTKAKILPGTKGSVKPKKGNPLLKKKTESQLTTTGGVNTAGATNITNKRRRFVSKKNGLLGKVNVSSQAKITKMLKHRAVHKTSKTRGKRLDNVKDRHNGASSQSTVPSAATELKKRGRKKKGVVDNGTTALQSPSEVETSLNKEIPTDASPALQSQDVLIVKRRPTPKKIQNLFDKVTQNFKALKSMQRISSTKREIKTDLVNGSISSSVLSQTKNNLASNSSTNHLPQNEETTDCSLVESPTKKTTSKSSKKTTSERHVNVVKESTTNEAGKKARSMILEANPPKRKYTKKAGAPGTPDKLKENKTDDKTAETTSSTIDNVIAQVISGKEFVEDKTNGGSSLESKITVKNKAGPCLLKKSKAAKSANNSTKKYVSETPDINDEKEAKSQNGVKPKRKKRSIIPETEDQSPEIQKKKTKKKVQQIREGSDLVLDTVADDNLHLLTKVPKKKHNSWGLKASLATMLEALHESALESNYESSKVKKKHKKTSAKTQNCDKSDVEHEGSEKDKPECGSLANVETKLVPSKKRRQKKIELPEKSGNAFDTPSQLNKNGTVAKKRKPMKCGDDKRDGSPVKKKSMKMKDKPVMPNNASIRKNYVDKNPSDRTPVKKAKAVHKKIDSQGETMEKSDSSQDNREQHISGSSAQSTSGQVVEQKKQIKSERPPKNIFDTLGNLQRTKNSEEIDKQINKPLRRVQSASPVRAPKIPYSDAKLKNARRNVSESPSRIPKNKPAFSGSLDLKNSNSSNNVNYMSDSIDLVTNTFCTAVTKSPKKKTIKSSAIKDASSASVTSPPQSVFSHPVDNRNINNHNHEGTSFESRVADDNSCDNYDIVLDTVDNSGYYSDVTETYEKYDEIERLKDFD